MHVSVIMPIRNEKKYIQNALDSLLIQDYPREKLEIICIDGMSDDGTREKIADYCRKHSNIKLLDNPKRATSSALNIGIKRSSSEIVIRVDAHSMYPSNYVSKLVKNLTELKAENVGGVCETKAIGTGHQSQVINTVLRSRLGVGNSLFRVGVSQVTEVDTVPFGCFRRTTLDRIGYFDERLYRTEDYELNQRIRKNGGQIFLIPDIKIQYFPPEKLWVFYKKQFSNGYGVVETSLLFRKLSYMSLRHFVPLAFVVYLFTLLLSFYFTILFIPLFAYLICVAVFSLINLKNLNSLQSKCLLPMGYVGTHLSYGTGSLYALLEISGKIMKKHIPRKMKKYLSWFIPLLSRKTPPSVASEVSAQGEDGKRPI